MTRRAPAAKGRRGQGDGSIYRRDDGQWVGTLELEPFAGKRRRKVVYARSRTDLVRKLAAVQERLDSGRPILDTKRTTGDYLDYWVKEILPGTITDNTLQGYRYIVRRDITPYVGQVPLAQLRPEHVHLMMRALEKRGLSPRTVSYARAVLRRALRHAERWDMVTRNVAALVDPPRQRRHEPDHLDLTAVRTILAAAPADRLGALYALAVTCGLRRGEALALWWQDLDLDAAVVHVRAGLVRIAGQGLVRDQPKTPRSRRSVPLPAATVQLLRAHRRRSQEEALARGRGWTENDYVFTTEAGTAIDPSNLTGMWHRFCDDAGLARCRLHALRHTAATLWLTQGVPLAVISKMLGHAGLAITADIYAAVVPDLQRDAADAMQRALGE